MDALSPQIWRFSLLITAFVALFALVGMRLQHLQLAQGSQLVQMNNKQHERTWTLPAARGSITDASGAPLAESASTWTLCADPLYMVDRLSATVELNNLLGIDRGLLRTEFETQRNGRVLARGLDDRQADQVRALKIEGVYLRRDFVRVYREGGLGAHLLGFVNAEGRGAAGLELELEPHLAGTAGKESVLIDAHGQPLVADGVHIPPRAGALVALTIDVELQRLAEKELADEVARSQPANAVVLLVEPTTGNIVAMASWPTFQPADHAGLSPLSMRNNAVAFVYEPGSTMKPLVAGAAVSEGLTTWNERIFCEHGKWTCHDGRSERTITDHSYKNGGHDMLTVTQGIALSDNILMAKLGLRLGVERLWRWENLFGFGRRCGIALPGEDAGIMLPHDHWSVLGSCMSVPMGHEIAVTPLQLAMAHCAIANGGVWLPPRLIKRISTTDDAGHPVDQPLQALPEPRRIFSTEIAAEIQDAMTHTMTEGTGKDVQLDGYTAAGKTGTAEKLIDGKYSHDHHVGSFICWAPASRGVRPELLCLVVIDDPAKGGQYGAENAAPTVQHILQQALEMRGVPKQLPVAPTVPGMPSAPAASERGSQVAQAEHHASQRHHHAGAAAGATGVAR
jgi:cell division protein FtsI/penicillin-binding protein 2